jgi:hypothetical protein
VSTKPIQDQLGDAVSAALGKAIGQQTVRLVIGQSVMDAVTEFALLDEPSVEHLEADTFRRVKDPRLRNALARTLFGARWLYKLGLVTYATSDRRAAHIRAQLIDYGAICEAVITDMLAYGIERSLLKGMSHRYANARGKTGKELTWSGTEPRRQLRLPPCNFSWKIDVAQDEHVLAPTFAVEVHRLRKMRNTVHLAERVGSPEYLKASADAYSIMHKCVERCGHWLDMHP